MPSCFVSFLSRRHALISLLAFCTPGHAEILEQTLHWNVLLHTLPTQPQHTVLVTEVKDTQRARRPWVVLLHGRPADPNSAKAMGQVKYPANARYFAERGYAVFVPTRVGYGFTGGPDLEYSGPCDAKRYDQSAPAVVDEVGQLIARIQTLPDIDANHGLIVGESTGGVAAIALAAKRPRGLVGVVNISGGDGGSPAHLDEPCGGKILEQAFEAWGRTSKLPSLWMYSLNDRFWGLQWPHLWFDAYIGGGGRGTFVQLPADKNNGHYIFMRNALAWHPAFERFAQTLGLPTTQPDKTDRKPFGQAN